MTNTACLTQPFSYTAGLPQQEKEVRNPLHELNQSVSFGRFMTETLAWEKWSTFSHRKYVEEAEQFSRPGSVAQMKAFFEAHYKNIAARKAAEAANAAAAASMVETSVVTLGNDNSLSGSEQIDNIPDNQNNTNSITDSATDNDVIADPEKVTDAGERKVGESADVESLCHYGTVDDREDETTELHLSGEKQMEKPLLQCHSSRKNDSFVDKQDLVSVPKASSVVSPSPFQLFSLRNRKDRSTTPMTKVSSLECSESRKRTPNPSSISINLTPAKDIRRITSSVIRKLDSSRGHAKAPQGCVTPMKPIKELLAMQENSIGLVTPQLVNNRGNATPLQSSASGAKNSRPRWNFLPTDCSKFMSNRRNATLSPVVPSPFTLRTEERAARRKEKLEEKFNAEQTKKVQLQSTLKEKAEAELKKLCQSIRFKARPLPEFYKKRPHKNNAEKVPQTPTSQAVKPRKLCSSGKKNVARTLIVNDLVNASPEYFHGSK